MSKMEKSSHVIFIKNTLHSSYSCGSERSTVSMEAHVEECSMISVAHDYYYHWQYEGDPMRSLQPGVPFSCRKQCTNSEIASHHSNTKSIMYHNE